VYLNFYDKGKISAIDIEIQQESNPGYSLIKRGIYYACRSVSSQLGAVTGQTNFDKLHKVYSIWLMVKPDTDGKAGIATIKPSLSGDAGLLQKKYIADVDLMEIDFVYAGDMSDIDSDKQELFFWSTACTEIRKILKSCLTADYPNRTSLIRRLMTS